MSASLIPCIWAQRQRDRQTTRLTVVAATGHIGLVTVEDQQCLISLPVGQEQAVVSGDAILPTLMLEGIVCIVIADEQIEPSVIIKPVEQVKDVMWASSDVAETAVLPELVPVANFYIGETVVKIMIECGLKYGLCCKSVHRAVVTTMAIAEEYDAGIIIERDRYGRLQRQIYSPKSYGTPGIYNGAGKRPLTLSN
ncbi:MAG: hypothetical protein R3C44_06920 [Chloroflexota bacterium]